jgi:FkbM family methyltransferase
MYSQQHEDDLIGKLLDGVTGKLLDIGAWNPVTFSNSRLLIKRGWKAVLVEPSPGPVRDLAREYYRNENVQVVAAAVSLEATHLLSMDVTDDAVSTSDLQALTKWAEAGGYYGTILVPTVTISELQNQFGSFQFVSIDAEGTSVDLARAYIETGDRPKVMIVEHDNRLVELISFMQPEYRLELSNDTNAIFKLK